MSVAWPGLVGLARGRAAGNFARCSAGTMGLLAIGWGGGGVSYGCYHVLLLN